jgi:ribosome-associated protein
MLVVNQRLSIPLREFCIHLARSSGPGGQNVNKVSSKAVLRWPVASSPSLPDDVRRRLMAAQARRITAQGDLLVTSQRFRDAGRNVADCLEKLRSLLLEVAAAPTPRRATRPTRGSVRRRLKSKQAKADKKQSRRFRESE